MLNSYETIFILKPGLDEIVVDVIKRKYRKLLAGFSGRTKSGVHTEDWGEKKLAYPISTYKNGYYLLMEFYAPEENISALTEAFTHDPNIIKHVVVRKAEDVEPSEDSTFEDDPEEEFEYAEVEAEAEAFCEQDPHKKPVDVFDLIFGIKEG